MATNVSNEYLTNAVMTASPEQLHLMLYDGAIRFSMQAREAMSRGEFETSCEKLLRAQRIVLELRSGLRPEINPALCDQLSALYSFIYNRLVDANMKREIVAIEDALKILNHQRETWQMLMDKIRESKGSAAGRQALQQNGANPALALSLNA